MWEKSFLGGLSAIVLWKDADFSGSLLGAEKNSASLQSVWDSGGARREACWVACITIVITLWVVYPNPFNMVVTKGSRVAQPRIETGPSGVVNWATPKSQACWCDSQNTPTTLVMVTPSHCLPLQEAHSCTSHTSWCPSRNCPSYFPHPVCPIISASPITGVPHHGVTNPGCPSLGITAHTQCVRFWWHHTIPLLKPFVAKGSRVAQPRTKPRPSGLVNWGPDRYTTEPISLVWQSEHTHNPSDGHSITIVAKQ